MKEEMTDMSEIGILADLVSNHVSAMLAYWDKDLICRFANDAYLGWFGRPREEMVNKISLPELLGPVLFEKNRPYAEGALRGETQTFERILPVPGSETVRYSLANYFPHIIDGAVKGFIVHVADITSVKHLERDLMHSNATITEQNKRLLNFANIVTHDLKSYANNLGIMLDIYKKAVDDAERTQIFNFLLDISSGFSSTIRNLAEIVDVKNNEGLRPEQLNLRSFSDKTIDSLAVEISSIQAQIENHIDPETVVSGNPAYLDSIFLNLLTNALKYRHPGRRLLIELQTRVSDAGLILTVQDNGLGIDLAKHRDEVFGMYRTFHGNSDAKGIGLYLVRSQIEAMGGRIEVESEVGTGTRFILYFNS